MMYLLVMFPAVKWDDRGEMARPVKVWVIVRVVYAVDKEYITFIRILGDFWETRGIERLGDVSEDRSRAMKE